MDAQDPDLVRRANSLYWDSDESVNDIAEALDLSKGSLYAAIRPRQAGYACPECGNASEYSNRTAKEKGMVSCPACGLEEELELIEAVALEDEGGEAVGGWTPLGETSVSSRTAVASTLLGLAAGIAIGQLLRKN